MANLRSDDLPIFSRDWIRRGGRAGARPAAGGSRRRSSSRRPAPASRTGPSTATAPSPANRTRWANCSDPANANAVKLHTGLLTEFDWVFVSVRVGFIVFCRVLSYPGLDWVQMSFRGGGRLKKRRFHNKNRRRNAAVLVRHRTRWVPLVFEERYLMLVARFERHQLDERHELLEELGRRLGRRTVELQPAAQHLHQVGVQPPHVHRRLQRPLQKGQRPPRSFWTLQRPRNEEEMKPNSVQLLPNPTITRSNPVKPTYLIGSPAEDDDVLAGQRRRRIRRRGAVVDELEAARVRLYQTSGEELAFVFVDPVPIACDFLRFSVWFSLFQVSWATIPMRVNFYCLESHLWDNDKKTLSTFQFSLPPQSQL